MNILYASIIVFFSLVMISLAGLVCCEIKRNYTLERLLEIVLIITVSIFILLCCIFTRKPIFKMIVPNAIYQRDTVYVCQSLSERELLILSIMSVESNFNPEAEGKQGDTGILQIRQIYVDEVNRILGYDKYTLSDAYDVNKSLEMFDILQNYHNPNRDFIKTIYYHNKSDAYQTRIIKEYNRLLLYESMRDKIINRYK